MAEIEAGFGGVPDLDARALAGRIRESVGDQAPPAVHRALMRMAREDGDERGRGWVLMACAAAASAVLVMLVLWWPGEPRPPEEGIRTKGAVRLLVFRKKGEAFEPTASGERFSPGDVVKFGVSVPAEGHLMVLGVEADGERYVAFPADGSELSRPVQATTGPGEALPGAVELDDSMGEERLHLVFCKGPFDARQVGRAADGGLLVPGGCLRDVFVLQKKENP
jgi:hypothetical protein